MTLLYDWLKTSAKARGNNKALVYRDNYLSWRGLLHRVDRRAQEFKSMGIKEGEWVGLMLGNVPDFVILGLALSKLGAVVIPIDPTTGTRELELILAAAPLRALITRPRGSEATGAMPTPPAPDGEDEVPEIRRRLQGTLLTCSVFKRESPKDPNAAIILFTSDSLGDPKGVVRSPGNLETIANIAVKSLEVTNESRILVAVPLYHAYGWDLGFLPPLLTGATMYLEEEISARRVAKLLRDHTIDILPGTPLMYGELSTLPTAKPHKAKNPRFISGGAPLNIEVAEAMAEKYEINLMSCYHSTETGVVAMDLKQKSPKTVGPVLEPVELKITDTKGAPITGAKKGLIWVKGPTLAQRQIGPYEEVSKKAALPQIGSMDDDGWLRTGDLGKMDKSGRLTLVGREDDVVKIGGKRVALGEVEGCLETFPKIRAAKARLVSEPFTGSIVVAKVVATGKCDPEEIIDHCARNLAPYKVPRRIEFSDDV